MENQFFPTKAEAAYPEELCRKVATLVKQAAVDKGANAVQPAYSPMAPQEEVRASRKHGWANLHPLVAEYKTDPRPDHDQVAVFLTSLAEKRGWQRCGIVALKFWCQSYKPGDALYGIYRRMKSSCRRPWRPNTQLTLRAASQ